MEKEQRPYKGLCIGGPLAGKVKTSAGRTMAGVNPPTDFWLRPADINEPIPNESVTPTYYRYEVMRAGVYEDIGLWVVEGVSLYSALNQLLLAYMEKHDVK